jgi:hypothetical protein
MQLYSACSTADYEKFTEDQALKCQLPQTILFQSSITNAFFIIDGEISLLHVLEKNLARILQVVFLLS